MSDLPEDAAPLSPDLEVEPGNIDVHNRPMVQNEDGSTSTVRTMGMEDENSGLQVNVPTVVDGKVVSEDDAAQHYYETGEHLGKYVTVEGAERAAQKLHEEQAVEYGLDQRDLPPEVPLHDMQAEARTAGYSWGDIHGHVAQSSAAAQDEGYSQPEIDSYLGLPSQSDLMHRLGVTASTMFALDPDKKDEFANLSDQPPEEGKPAEIDLSSDEIRGRYADALMKGEARGATDFSQLYGKSVQLAAQNAGLELSDGQLATLGHASDDFASKLPSNSELTDQAIGIAHEAGLAVNADSVRVVKNNLADYWAATGDKEMYQRAVSDPAFMESVVQPPKVPPPPVDPGSLMTPEVEEAMAQGLPLARIATQALLGASEAYAEPLGGDPAAYGDWTFLHVVAKNADAILRMPGAAFNGVASGFSQALKEMGVPEADADRTMRDAIGIFTALGAHEPMMSPAMKMQAVRDGLVRARVQEIGDKFQAPMLDLDAKPGEAIKTVPARETLPDPLMHEEAKQQALLPRVLADESGKVPGEQPAQPKRPSYKFVEQPETTDAYQGIEGHTTYQLHKDGEPVGFAEVTLKDEGKTAYIDNIASDERAGSMGPRAVRDLAKQYFEENPKVEQIEGWHVGGSGSSTRGPQDMTLYRDQVIKEPKPAEVQELADGYRVANVLKSLMLDQSGAVRLPELFKDRGEPGKVRDLIANPFRTEKQLFEKGEKNAGEIAARDLIRKNTGTIGAQEVAWAVNKVEEHYSDLQQHMPAYLAELAKGPGADLGSTVIGRIKNAIEGNIAGGAVNPNGRWKPFLDAVREIAENNKGNIETVLPDFQSRITHYYAHMYTDPRMAEKVYTGYGKQGSGASLNERSIPYEQDAVARGLMPRYPHPIDNVIASYSASQHHLAWQTVLKEGNDLGHVEWKFPGSQTPGWAELNGAMTTKMFVDADGKPQMLKAYGSPGFERNYNNRISAGWNTRPEQGTILDRLRTIGNAMTQANLVLPFYHAWNIAQESLVAAFDHAAADLYGGHFLKGVKEFGIEAVRSPYTLAKRGREVQQAYLNKVNDPVLNALAEANMRVGGRQEVYLPGHANSYITTFTRGTTKSELVQSFNRIAGATDGSENVTFRAAAAPARLVGFMGRELGRAMRTFSEPLFDHYIPWVKLGVNYAKMDRALRENPASSPEAVRRMSREIVDHTDNQFGEMNQDNLFWPKVTKQTLNLSTVSLGFEYGSLRLMASGVRDVAMLRLNTPAARWAMVGFPLTWAIQSTIYQALHTHGTTPFTTGAKNFLFPQTGGTTPEGKPETAVLPGYGKDVLNYFKALVTAHNPFELGQNLAEIAHNKAPALLRIAQGVLTGVDSQGHDIQHYHITGSPPFDIPKDYWNWARFMGGEMEPFFMQQKHYKGSALTLPERLIGLRPSPSFIDDPARFESGRAAHEKSVIRTEESRYKNEQRRLEGGQPNSDSGPGYTGGGPGSRGGRGSRSRSGGDDRYQNWGQRSR